MGIFLITWAHILKGCCGSLFLVVYHPYLKGCRGSAKGSVFPPCPHGGSYALTYSSTRVRCAAEAFLQAAQAPLQSVCPALRPPTHTHWLCNCVTCRDINTCKGDDSLIIICSALKAAGMEGAGGHRRNGGLGGNKGTAEMKGTGGAAARAFGGPIFGCEV